MIGMGIVGQELLQSTDSFLFNFTDGTNISTSKLGYVNNPNYAVYCYNSQEPRMGDCFCHTDNNWVNYDTNVKYYPNIGIPKNFTVENYEVFQIIKNRKNIYAFYK